MKYMEPCWLCQFNHTSDAKTLASFIADNVGCASTQSVAFQVAEDLQDRFPDTPGTSYEACLRHIEHHTLHPICRISTTMLRSLLKLSDDLQQNLRKFDEDGNAIVPGMPGMPSFPSLP